MDVFQGFFPVKDVQEHRRFDGAKGERQIECARSSRSLRGSMLARLAPLSSPPGHSRSCSNGSPPIRARPPCRPAGASHSNRDQRARMHGPPGLSAPGFPCQARPMISSEHCPPVQVCEKMNHLHRQRESRDGRLHARQDYPCVRVRACRADAEGWSEAHTGNDLCARTRGIRPWPSG